MNELERQVIELIGENSDSPDVFVEGSREFDLIRGSLNDAIAEIAVLTGSVKDTYHLSLESGKAFYRLRFNRGSLIYVTDAYLTGQTRRLERTSPIRLNAFNSRWMQNTGSPESYFQVGFDIIGFWPKPGGTDLVRFDCVIAPARYSGGNDRIRLRDSFQFASVQYAVSEFYASRGDAKRAGYHFQQYAERMGLNRQYPFQAERVWQFKTDKSGNARPTGG